MHAEVSIGRRAARWVARRLGGGLGVGALMLLRLTGRKAGVALLYHSVSSRAGDSSRELVPPHDVSLFEQQIALVRRHYDIVSAQHLQAAVRARRRGRRFPVAITFDDDLACHAGVALPVLQRLGVTATFFLSGASLDHPFAFPYERLQRAFDEGFSDVAGVVLGATGGTAPHDIHELGRLLEDMTRAERSAASARLSEALGHDPADAGIRSSQVRELADAGMTIGFHTRRHEALTLLSSADLREAMDFGRDELAAVAGQRLHAIAYPHGRVDQRVADAAREAGFEAGFTTAGVAVTPADDPLLQARIEPSFRSVGALAVQLAAALLRSGRRRSTPARASSAS